MKLGKTVGLAGKQIEAYVAVSIIKFFTFSLDVYLSRKHTCEFPIISQH